MVMRGIREGGGNAVTPSVTSLQRCVNGIVTARLHNDVEVMPVM
jgi:hypothetical protein